ncbi:unnamed protein product [Chilo suppressalis]|uniref:PHD-type domain-containing protein n=1 Tax=Chilo suppressalis TaxID=168631 RepID=A0ABN8BCK0_CHISP|nr:unnamed protein product [Chilo suppressalis]
MARKVGKDRNRFLAKLVTENKAPCAFCKREIDDETTFGKLYAIGDIQCHYFCVLLSCCLVQKGKDEDGLFGFLYPDILAEVERSKKHRCSYCSKDGATLGCSISQCRKQFHLPCGREKNAVSLFYGNYKSFCQLHAPKQRIPDVIMSKAKVRMLEKRKALKNTINQKIETEKVNDFPDSIKAEYVCVICYEDVDPFPTLQTFWPPCCARDAWFHRSCIQRMALSAGMHYLKCPLCNDKNNFYQAVVEQGYYVPDRDAAWELEQNAFAEIYERPLTCNVEDCLCPMGRKHCAETGLWDIKLCLLCGSAGVHEGCTDEDISTYICRDCISAAPKEPDELAKLAATIDQVIASEQATVSTTRARHPVMPSRMSLRRTKQRIAYTDPSSSRHDNGYIKTETTEEFPDTVTSRRELNLKSPKRRIKNDSQDSTKPCDNMLLSPVKLLELKLAERGTENVLEDSLVQRLKEKIGKPRPLSVKQKIFDNILGDIMNNVTREKRKSKEPVREWNSPKKETDVKNECEIQNVVEDTQEVNEQPTKEVSKETTEQSTEELPKTDEPPTIEINNEITEKEESTILDVDDSSNSTFQLAPEFVADHNSDESISYFETPKKTKTVEIAKDSSMEISERNDKINIDLIKIENANDEKTDSVETYKSPEKKQNVQLKFSPKVKNNDRMEIDIESFKNQYLNEVDGNFKCNYSHKHEESSSSTPKLRTAIDFAMEAAKTTRKRKLKRKKSSSNKKRKESHLVLKFEGDISKKKLSKRRKKSKKTELSITNDEMRVKISLKRQKFRLKIMQSRTPKTPKTLKQYVLKFDQNASENAVIEKPETDVAPMKRKYVKLEKSPDSFKQMSLHSFFKPISPKKEQQ